MLDQANIPIGNIQRILGHESRTTTEIYLHSIGNPERDAMVALDSMFESSDLEKSLTPTLTPEKKGPQLKAVTP
jgi:site-specific recombinase XerD